MLDPDDVGRLVAVFDWEMKRARRSARGSRDRVDVLVPDRAAGTARRAVDGHRSSRLFHATGNPRLATPPARAATSRASGTYEIFAVFKIAVVIQQIYYRYAQGQTTDKRFATFDSRVAYMARHAARLAEIPS